MRISYEGRRGCGYRVPGGLYLMSGALSEPCSKLPIELSVCPVCNCGIKPSRSWQWIEPDPLTTPEPHGGDLHSMRCPLGAPGRMGEKCGLLWIGEAFYSPQTFTEEAARMGVSRRIKSVPRGFEVGKTWVLVAHRKACVDAEGERVGGIFSAFKPTRIEYVVKGDETGDDLNALRDRGIEPVEVRQVEQLTLVA